MTPFRRKVTNAITEAGQAGTPLPSIMADMGVSIAALIRAASPNHQTRLDLTRGFLEEIKRQISQDLA